MNWCFFVGEIAKVCHGGCHHHPAYRRHDQACAGAGRGEVLPAGPRQRRARRLNIGIIDMSTSLFKLCRSPHQNSAIQYRILLYSWTLYSTFAVHLLCTLYRTVPAVHCVQVVHSQYCCFMYILHPPVLWFNNNGTLQVDLTLV